MSGMSTELVVIRRAEATDLSKVETVARTTWPVAYAGIIPDAVQQRRPDVRVVLVTVQDEAELVERGQAAGALGFVAKHRAGHELVPAVKAVLRGERYVSECRRSGRS